MVVVGGGARRLKLGVDSRFRVGVDSRGLLTASSGKESFSAYLNESIGVLL